MNKLFLFAFTVFAITSCRETIVKSDDSLIDQVVLMEDQIQELNIIQSDRGNGFKSDIREVIASTPKREEMNAKRTRLEYVFGKMEEIDEVTSSIISFIDECKLELLKNARENIKTVDKNNVSTIVWKVYDEELLSVRPTRLNLWAVKNKSDAKIATSYFVNSDGVTPSEMGLELWNKLNEYRSNLVKTVGSYSFGGGEYTIDPIDVNSYRDNKQLADLVYKMIDGSNANLKEDRQVLIDLYMSLTMNEWYNMEGKKTHWISLTFKNSPLVSAIASLTSLQHDILSARALAMAHFKSKVSINEYGFNKILPLAKGPSTAFEGEEVKIEVIMAAFDSDNQPEVTITDPNATITYDGKGKGIVSLFPKKGLNTVKGTVAIRNKSGVQKIENWEWKVNVIPK